MDNPRNAGDIRREMALLNAELRGSVRHERVQRLKKDKRMLDYIDGLQKAFENLDIESCKKIASYIHHAFDQESINPVTFDFKTQFDQYIAQGNAIKMPPEWGFYDKAELELERGLTYSIGARPGVGKSTSIANLAYYFGYQRRNLGHKVLIMTNEMKPAQFWVKLYQIHLNHTQQQKWPFMLAKNWVRYPEKFPEQNRKIKAFAEELSESMLVTSVRRQGVEEICLTVDEAKNELGEHPSICFLDYLQRIPRNSAFKTDERLSILDTVQALTEKMGDLDSIMFIASQMNKDGGFKGSEAPEEEAGVAWELSRDRDRDGKLEAALTWKIKKTRISPYFTVMTRYNDTSGTITRDPFYQAPSPTT